MIHFRLSSTVAPVLAVLALATPSGAATVFAVGSTVTSADRTATFDAINSNDISLQTYTEDSISVSVNNISFQGFGAFLPNDPRSSGFFYGRGGNQGYVSISATDGQSFSALDLLLGDGFGLTTTNLAWETLLGGAVTGSGLVTMLARGTTVGWSHLSGFDTLRIGASPYLTSLGNFQAIAIDDVRAQIAATVPLPASLPLLLGAVGAAGALRRRKRAV